MKVTLEDALSLLRADVVRVSVDGNRISLKRHQDSSDAIKDVAIFRFNVCLIKVETNRLAVITRPMAVRRV
jgi:hypothetical protein